MDRYRVIGPVEVGGVAPGGVVELDAGTINIPALIEAGHVEPVTKSSKGRGGADGEES